MAPAASNQLYFGDNLSILREHIADASIDLIYLDPPFNSQSNYNVLFRSPTGDSQAQIEAFEDTWHWGDMAERAFDEVVYSGNTDAAEMLRAMRAFLKENDMMAYLSMMSIRLLELHRVLKPTGSLYLHCDPTASHYLKILLDSIFHVRNFRNEIVWYYGQREGFYKTHFSKKHDTIFFYAKTSSAIVNKLAIPWAKDEFMKHRHDVVVDENGREIIMSDAAKDGQRYIRYVDDVIKEGKPLNSVWNIPLLNSAATERLGYPTQKPLTLLERIVQASSQEGDIVMDPFCGCGTAIHAAEKLRRRWIGIDITHLAISLIEKRLNDVFPGIHYDVYGTPNDLAGAHELANRDKYQFQWWAVSLVNAVPYGGKKKGADSGIDGIIYFKPDGKKTEKAIVSVKGGGNVSVAMIRDLAHVVDREHAQIGVFVTLAAPTGPMAVEATKAGFYTTPYHGKIAKIQILTIADLFAGKKPIVPFIDPTTFRRARPEDTDDQAQLFA